MCNEQRRTIELGRISDAFAQSRIPLRFPEGAPNRAPPESIRITDPIAIVRAARDEAGASSASPKKSLESAKPRPRKLIEYGP